MALCRKPVSVATSVGPGRAPPGRRTRAGRRDGGGNPSERNPFRPGSAGPPPPQGEASCGHHFVTGSRSFTSSLFPLPSSLPSPSPRATKIQQPKNFTLDPAQKISPHSLPSQTRANPGPIWVRTGLFRVAFGSLLDFPGSKSRRFGPHFPLPEAPSAPGDVQKLHLPARSRERTFFTPISQNRTKYNIIITNSP